VSVSVVRECETRAGKERQYEEKGTMKKGGTAIGTRKSFSSIKGVELSNTRRQ
jgi:hypothetical protein